MKQALEKLMQSAVDGVMLERANLRAILSLTRESITLPSIIEARLEATDRELEALKHLQKKLEDC